MDAIDREWAQMQAEASPQLRAEEQACEWMERAERWKLRALMSIPVAAFWFIVAVAGWMLVVFR